MIYLNGKFIFLQKNGVQNQQHITLSILKFQKSRKLRKQKIIKTGFMVTDASYFNKKLYLIGYTKKTEVFLDIFDETEPGIFLKKIPNIIISEALYPLDKLKELPLMKQESIFRGKISFSDWRRKTKPLFYSDR
jgi:hypothetical protein